MILSQRSERERGRGCLQADKHVINRIKQMITFLSALISQLRIFVADLLTTVLLNIVGRGAAPRHVAFIMDGNRRYAVKIGEKDRKLGHYHGYTRFEAMLDWCFKLGIHCITVYAFSVENFRRSREEVETLMKLAVDKLALLAEHDTRIKKNRVGIRIIGELSMLPLEVQQTAARAMEMTASYNNYILNICFPYVSKLELRRANELYSKAVLSKVHPGITRESLYRSCLDTYDSPDIDIMIRTAGDHRLSEFAIHQLCSSPNCQYEFVRSMWPEFSLMEFAWILFRYQNRHLSTTAPLRLPMASASFRRSSCRADSEELVDR